MAAKRLAVAAHLLALEAALALHVTQEAAGQVADVPVIWAFGCHHKTGTDLLKGIQQAWESRLGPTEVFTPENRHRESKQTGSRRYNCLDQTAYEMLQQGPSFRLVHVVRDPVELSMSAYWYHKMSWDVQLVPNTGPNALAQRSIQDGLRLEGAGEMQSTLPEMLDVYAASKSDSRVMTVGLEDFVDDFNGTLVKVYRHFFGPGDKMEAEMIAKAAAHQKTNDENEIEEPERADARGHITLARDAVNSDSVGPWYEIKAMRPRLNYMEARSGYYRHRLPVVVKRDTQPLTRFPPPEY